MATSGILDPRDSRSGKTNRIVGNSSYQHISGKILQSFHGQFVSGFITCVRCFEIYF